MPPSLKGIPGIYEYCCDGKFYDWVIKDRPEIPEVGIAPKQIFMAPVCYKDKESLTLSEVEYDALHEERSTWKIAPFHIGVRDTRLPHRPYKLFQLESGDDLIILKCKIRPVLVVCKLECNWRFPVNHKSSIFWLCLPLFSYKRRHLQEHVISDQQLQVPSRFYFPPGVPGLDTEAAGLLNQLQFIPEANLLYPHKCHNMDIDPPMDLPVQLSDLAFETVIGHIAKMLPEIEISGDAKEWYDFFKDLINEQIEKTLNHAR